MAVARVLTIAGSDSGGGAGIQADIKTITALGGFGMSVITALTAQNTLGVHGIHEIPPSFIERQFDAVASDIGVDAAKTGMLPSAEIMEAVAKKIEEYGIKKLVVDPVMAATVGTMLVRQGAKRTLIDRLLPLAYVITPNIPEAEELTGMTIQTVDQMEEAAKAIHRLGAANVFLKGGHLAGDALDLLYDGTDFHRFVAERIDTKNTHGTGCTTSAAIATGLAQGMSLPDAVGRAKEYITEAIRSAIPIGGGHGPVSHIAWLSREGERYRCIRGLRDAVQHLKDGRCGNIIPEIQSNLVCALPYARGVEDVAAIPGRIIRVGEGIETLHDPEFGASSHIASVILTVMRYDGAFRSAMDIRLSEDILRICKELGYDVDSFSRSDEPMDVKGREGSSLEWGTNVVLSRRSTIPDAIFDRGEVGKEPVIRILGRTPALVAEKVVSISRRLRESLN